MFRVLDPKDSGLDFRNLLKHKYVYCAKFSIDHIRLFITSLSFLSVFLCVIRFVITCLMSLDA